MLGTFAQYYVQASAEAINPSVTLTGGTDSFNTIAVAFECDDSGTAPSAGIRIVHVYHVWIDRPMLLNFRVREI